VVQTATTRILRRRFPGTCKMVEQVFKFVWRLHWKINVICMSLYTFFSFQSRFVTYLLTFPRICFAVFTLDFLCVQFFFCVWLAYWPYDQYDYYIKNWHKTQVFPCSRKAACYKHGGHYLKFSFKKNLVIRTCACLCWLKYETPYSVWK